jgi:hypothetical protein
MPLLIGIGHKKQRGKDTAANRLVDKHRFVRVSWADSLKESARIIFGFNDRQLYGDLKEVIDPYWGMSPRDALQRLGTDACRNHVHREIWIKSAWLRVQKIWEENPETGVVIPDVRFTNEADFIKEKGGVLWKVDRDLPEDKNSQHPSEIDLDTYDKWDKVIDNNSSLRKLYLNVDSGLAQIHQGDQRRPNVYNVRKETTN